ncbi:MAG: Diacylglycerol kinase [Bacteroidota bacterium]|jgi:YegS/Rv2252/BmrU family lipid kinase
MNFFIINPNAGSNSPSHFQKLISKIKEDPNCKIWETTAPLEAYKFAQKAIQEGASRIIAVGGDGTINEVASALVGTNTPLGIIPIGSGNGLARHLKIPLKINKALQLAKEGTPQKMDVGLLNDKYFFCTAGIGFDACVAQRFAAGNKRGFINYIRATFYTLFNYQPIQIAINNGPFEKVFSLTMANANQFGNNAYISPLSSVQDGLLEIIKIKKLSIFQAAIVGVRLFLGNIHKSKWVQTTVCKSIHIKYQNKGTFHLDGEQLYTNSEEIKVQIQPMALNIVC